MADPHRSAAERIGGPWALSLRVALLAYLATVALALLDAGRLGGSPLAWGACALAANTIVLLVLVPIRLRVFRGVGRRPRPMAAIVAFGVAGALRGTAMAALAVSTGLMPTWEWGYRQIGGALTAIVVLSVITLAVDAQADYRARLAALAAERERVADLERQLATIATAVERETRERLTAELGARLRVGDAAGAVDDVIQPLVDELVRQRIDLVMGQPAMRNPAFPWRGLIGEAARETPFHAATTALGIMAIAFAFLTFHLGLLRGVAATAALAGSTALCLWALGRVPRGGTARATTIAVGGALATAVIAAAVATIACASLPGARTTGVVAGVFALLVNTGAALASAASRLQAATERDLAVSLEARAWLVARAQETLTATRHALARTVHGPVQSALIRTAALLEAPDADRDAIVAAALAEVEISLARDAPGVGGTAALEQLAEAWRGIASIDLAVDDGARVALDEDVVCAAAALEICREGISNAVRHARADTCAITINAEVGALRIVVRSPGRLRGERRGLGTDYLDRVCLAWSRVSANGEVVLTAQIPAATP
jgi:hypothetical protein